MKRTPSTDADKIMQLLESSDPNNHALAEQLLKGNKILAMEFVQESFIRALIRTMSPEKIAIALFLLRSDKALKESICLRYLPLIEFTGASALKVLINIKKRVTSIEQKWDLQLNLKNWQENDSFEEHLRKQAITSARFALKPLRTLPNFLTALTELETFFISKCRLKTIPDFWDKFPNLKRLEIRNNHLTDLPPSFKALQKVEHLALDNNRFVTIPPEIAAMKALKKFYIGNKELVALPDWIGDLENLTYLALDESSITKLPLSFSKLKKLTYLSFWRTPLEKQYNFKWSSKPSEIQAIIKTILDNQ